MMDRNQAKASGDVFEFSRGGAPEAPQPTERPRTPPRPRPPMSGRSSAWQSTALFMLCMVLVVALGLAFHAYDRASVLEDELVLTRGEMQESLQQLRAGLDFGDVRRQLLLGIRDEILRVNEDISLGEAYHYAELLLRATDKYPTVDPVLLLSIGIVESEFEVKAKSPANARGLYQIWPSTGRMLAGMLGWEYSVDMLHDPARNTEMAALYLDILLTTYNDVGMALAEYNGGPINAGYYRAGSHRAAEETRDYVPKVLENYERLTKSLPITPGRSYDIVYRDASRSGKRLGVAD